MLFKYSYISGLVLFLFLFSIIYIASFYHPVKYSNNLLDRLFVTLRFLFVTENNRLNWISISASGVMISYVINSKFNRDKFRADLVSTARIKWLDNTKNITSEFIKDVLMINEHYVMYMQKTVWLDSHPENISLTKSTIKRRENEGLNNEEFKESLADFENDIEQYNDEMKEKLDVIKSLQDKIEKNSLLIKLNFSENKENNEIVSICDHISYDLRKYGFVFENIQSQKTEVKLKELNTCIKRISEHNEDLASLTDKLRDYNKKEWEKIKLGN